MKSVINWFEIYTSDFERAKRFYTTVFNYELTDLPTDKDRHTEMKYAFFPGGEREGCGALVKLEEVQPGNGGTTVYFASEEINEELSRVEAAGGKIIRPKLEINEYGFMAFIEDTEGNLIGLYSTK